MKNKYLKLILVCMTMIAAVISIQGLMGRVHVSAKQNRELPSRYIETDSHNDLFYYSLDYTFSKSIEKNWYKKKYIDKNKKTSKGYTSMSGSGSIEEPYIWSDKERDGVFYTTQSTEKDKGYLVYDDARGKNVFKIKLKKLNSVFRKNNIRPGTVVNVGRFGNKAIIIMVATVYLDDSPKWIKLAYSCAVYDMGKNKIVSNSILEKYSQGENGFALRNPQIDGRYVYFVEQSGDCKKKVKGKLDVTDNRKRAVVVYDYSGKRVNKIDYSSYIERYTKYYGSAMNLFFEEENSMCVNNGKVYVATRTGIYKCTSLGKKFEKVCDAGNTGLSNLAGRALDFRYINDKKFVYVYTTDENNENIYMDTIRQ